MAASFAILLFAFFAFQCDAARIRERGTITCADIIPGSGARNRDKSNCKCKKGTLIVGDAEECALLKGQRYFSPDTSLTGKCRCEKEGSVNAASEDQSESAFVPLEVPETVGAEAVSDQLAPDVETVTETNVAAAAADQLVPNVETNAAAASDGDQLATTVETDSPVAHVDLPTPDAERDGATSDEDQLETEAESNGVAADDNELEPPVDASDTPPVDVSDTPPVDISETAPVDVSETPPVDVSDAMNAKEGTSGYDSMKIIILGSLLLLCVVGVLGGVCYYQLFPRNPVLARKDAVAPPGGGKLAVGGAEAAPSRDVLAIHGAQS